MKILILIMSHETTSEEFVNYKRIWDKQIENLDYEKFNVDFKFLYSDENLSEDYIVQGNNLITNCVENYWYSLLLKVMSGFDFFIKNDFDYVFKTNLSTIINFDKFYNYCEQISQDRNFVYDGMVGSYQNFNFCSGAGMLLNKASVNVVLKNKELINESWTDDIFIGFVLNKLNNITPNEGGINRFDISNVNTHFTKENIKNYTHIRIKVRKNNLDIYYSNLIYEYLMEI